MATVDSDILRIGIVGLGTAGRLMIPAVASHPGAELAGIAETNEEVRETVASESGVRAYADIGALLNRSDVDAVYLATPTMLHAAHARAAAAAGKHILVEKPMAGSVADAGTMVDAAKRAGVVLMVGHSRSYDSPIRKMREIIRNRHLGRVRMIHSLVFTDWIYRPRRPDELDPAQGGGVLFRQGAHQFDVIRLLGGGLVETVYAATFDWDVDRSALGAHAIFLKFADGTAATAVYNGYGAFSTAELCFGIGERGFPEGTESIGAARRGFEQRQAGSELSAKRQRSAGAVKPNPPHNPFFGLTIASCEKGDIRQSPDGLYTYGARGREEVVLAPDISPHHVVLDEFHAAATGRQKPLHDGLWGMANLEICEAAMRSSALGSAVRLQHQVAADA